MKRNQAKSKRTRSKKHPRISFEILNELDRTSAIDAAVTEVGSFSLGIYLKEPLKVGQLLKFTKMKSIGTNLPAEGIVMWTIKENRGMKAGVNFRNS